MCIFLFHEMKFKRLRGKRFLLHLNYSTTGIVQLFFNKLHMINIF